MINYTIRPTGKKSASWMGETMDREYKIAMNGCVVVVAVIKSGLIFRLFAASFARNSEAQLTSQSPDG